VQSTITAQGSSLQLPDILVDFGTTNITSLAPAQGGDSTTCFKRAAAVAGLTQ
jgi:hypothetical protein